MRLPGGGTVMVVGLHDNDVVVVGAGLSGLVAARKLEARGAKVAVVEARDRVGGKLSSVTVEGVSVDLGAVWFSAGDGRVASLGVELGVASVPSAVSGRVIHHFNGRRRAESGHTPRLPSLISRVESDIMVRRLQRLCERVPSEYPWFAPDAQRFDSMTLEDFKRRTVWTAGARSYVDFLSRLLLCAEPKEVSFLYFLSRLRSAGGVHALLESVIGVGGLRFVAGAQALCEAICAALLGDVILGDPVVSIEQDEEGVTVRTERREVRGRYVIVALSPMLSGRLRYSPPLPAQRDALVQRMPLGAGTKAIVVFERPWWREQGLAALAMSDSGLVRCVFDVSPPDASRGVLAALITAQAARDLGPMSLDARRRAVLAAIARLFGLNEIVPLSYIDHSWDIDPWSRGLGAGYMGPGTMTTLGAALREPTDRLHWAGAEMARTSAGYLEGAAEAGERVAEEVLARIGEHRRRIAAGA
jgi:monoamine oxidase